MRGIVEMLELIGNVLGIAASICMITILLGAGGFAGSIFFLGLLMLLSKSIFVLDKLDIRIFEENRKRIRIISEILEKYKEVRLKESKAVLIGLNMVRSSYKNYPTILRKYTERDIQRTI